MKDTTSTTMTTTTTTTSTPPPISPVTPVVAGVVNSDTQATPIMTSLPSLSTLFPTDDLFCTNSSPTPTTTTSTTTTKTIEYDDDAIIDHDDNVHNDSKATTNEPIQKKKRKRYYTRCPCGMHLHIMNGNLDGEEYVPSTIEEVANTITHLIPALLSIVILPSLFKMVANTERELLSAQIYGGCCTLLFSISTLYHLSGIVFGKETPVNNFFLKLDMTAIFAFIAASYTPWGLLIDVGQDNVYGRSMITFIWLFALFGTFKNLLGILPNIPSLYVYLGMGWISAIYLLVLIGMILGGKLHPLPSMWGIAEIFLGGFLYNIGTVVFKMDGKLPFAHAIWHIFVALAAAVHLHAVIEHVMCLE